MAADTPKLGVLLFLVPVWFHSLWDHTGGDIPSCAFYMP